MNIYIWQMLAHDPGNDKRRPRPGARQDNVSILATPEEAIVATVSW